MSTVSESLNLKDDAPFRGPQVLSKQLQYALDLVILVAAFTFSYLLRFEFFLPAEVLPAFLAQLPFVIGLQVLTLQLTGVNKFIWRYIGLAEVKGFVLAGLLSVLPLVILRSFLPDSLQLWRVPVSIIFINTLLAFGGLLSLRVARREQYERSKRNSFNPARKNRKAVLLIGAGRAGVLTANEIKSRGDFEVEVKGFVDDDPKKTGAIISGVTVLGKTSELSRLVTDYEIDHVIISIAEINRRQYKRILDICESVPVKVRTIPGLYEILQGNVKVSRIRDVQIEDLLGREAVNLDDQSVRELLSGKTVMVTGAGGSIGSELTRQVARFNPEHLLLVERSEFALFNIERELRFAHPQLSVHALIADIGDERRMRSIFSAHRTDVVLHAAAHKHVPMMEVNTSEAIKNNVLATHVLGRLAGEFGVNSFVLISTDKAVRPSSVMGATKRVAEIIIQDLDDCYQTKYVAVRFGNVIGSAGSVIPIFREQIYKGGPVTVTHPDMVRYFMTIPEASQLVLQAGAIGKGAEIFILDMGEPVKILDLAKATITLSGLKPFEDIDITFTGIRPGEKLFEELDTKDEELTKTRHSKIFIGKITKYSHEKVRLTIEHLAHLADKGWDEEVRRQLNDFLPEARLECQTSHAVQDHHVLSNEGFIASAISR